MKLKGKWKRRGIDKVLLMYGVLTIGIGSAFGIAAYQTEEYTKEKQVDLMKKAINQALMQCYAIEGAYPEDMQKLSEGYGIKIDESRYIVHYERFASNIIPKIKVLPRKEKGK